jgi:Holliday junction resolvasome RuvABC DNA-binding subunit
VLSGGTPESCCGALRAGDTARFQAVPGIGKRTAERIVVELREKAGVTPDEDDGPIVVRRATTRARSRATACSSSDSTRARPTRCCVDAAGDSAEAAALGGR